MAESNKSAAPQRTLSARQIRLAAIIVALSFVFSGILGVVRQAIIGGSFGAGVELDSFYAAYRIPELLFTLIAGGALGSAFIPVYSRYLQADDLDGAWQLANAVITLVTFLGILLAVIAAILGEQIVSAVLLPSASLTEKALTTELMRIMLITVVIFGISGLMMGILNANQRFLAPALAPSFNNIGLILGALFLTPIFGVRGLAFGAILGAVLHLVVQLPSLRGINARLYPSLQWRIPGVLEVLKLMGPRVLGSAVVQVNFVVNAALTSGMRPGSLTALTAAFGLMFTVLGVLGQSVGTAVFPTLSLYGAKGDQNGFRSTLAGALRSVLFTSIPASVGMIVLAVPLVATVYQHGRWTGDDTIATAFALQFFALGLAAFALQEVLARAFFALRDTMTPVLIGIGGMLLNVCLSLAFIRFVQGDMPVFGKVVNPLGNFSLWILPAGQGPFAGLALANALATMIESAALWLFLRRRFGSLEERVVLTAAARVLIASVGMGVLVWILVHQISDRSPLLILIVGTIFGAAVFEAIALLLGLPEARSVPTTLLKRFRR